VISTLILTMNEAENLRRLLAELRWCDDIVVLDSGSTDETVAVARRAGARVFCRSYDDEKSQRTYSIGLPFKYKWVYNPDADEIPTENLISEMERVVRSGPTEVAAYRCRFKNMFMNRWLRYSSLYPTWVVRIFKPDKLRFEREVNLRYIVDGEEGRLRSHFLHYSFAKGIEEWMRKHVRYARLEALETIRSLHGGSPSFLDLFATNPIDRRCALKEWSFRMPFRPLLRFLYMYILRRGFADGRAGLIYCRLLALYEEMIVLNASYIRFSGDLSPKAVQKFSD